MAALKRLGNNLLRVVRRSRFEIARLIMPSTAVLGPKVIAPLSGPLSQRGEIKLNLGCGPMHLDGYLNVDADPRACADLYLDYLKLGEVLSPGSVREILMVHSLSYLNLWQAREFFRLAHRLLVSGGELIVELPSIENCARRLLDSRGKNDDYLEAIRGIYAFDPSEITNQIVYTPYSFGWSDWHLDRELHAAGFSATAVSPPQYHEQPWRDIRVTATR